MPEAKQKCFQIWRDLLMEACQTYGWRMAVLTQEDGLPLVAAPNGDSVDALIAAAVSAQCQRAADLVRRQQNGSSLVQFILTLSNRSRLVGRCFESRGENFVLLVLLTGRQAYRQAMERTIQSIRQAWERH